MSETPAFDRRHFLAAAAATVAAPNFDLLASSGRVTAMTEMLTASEASEYQKAEIRPFRVNVPQSQLDDLHRRVQATNWPEAETVKDTSQGVQLATMQKLARYWVAEHDWRKVEARLNSLPQFLVEIDGLDIHF